MHAYLRRSINVRYYRYYYYYYAAYVFFFIAITTHDYTLHVLYKCGIFALDWTFFYRNLSNRFRNRNDKYARTIYSTVYAVRITVKVLNPFVFNLKRKVKRYLRS